MPHYDWYEQKNCESWEAQAMAKFITAINCMDGRAQLPVIEYLKSNFKVDYVDMITMPGVNKILTEQKDKVLIDYLKNCVDISVKRHGSNAVAIVGHHDCAGNPVDKQSQYSHIRRAMELIKSCGFEGKILGLYVNENWQVEVVSETNNI